jgi:hypothetical protein
LTRDRDIFETWLRGALNTHPNLAIREDVAVRVDGFDIAGGGELPSMETLQKSPEAYDVVMLTGSSRA